MASPSSGENSPLTPAGTPVSSAAPKYGTLIPNRIFVGGIASNTSEVELKQFFSAYGAVKDCKIIMDRAGVSKGYGFVTFESQEDAEKIIKKEGDNLIFKDRKLNIGPAIRKQQAFPRLYEPSLSPSSAVMYSNGVPYTYQNGMAVFSSDAYALQAQHQAAYPVMVSPPQYTALQPNYYQSPTPAATANQWAAATGQWRWAPTQQSPATPVAGAQYLYQPMQHAGAEAFLYQQPHAAAAYQTAADMADGSSMMEAGPAAAEGSFSTTPQQRAEVTTRSRYVETPTTNSCDMIMASTPSPNPATRTVPFYVGVNRISHPGNNSSSMVTPQKTQTSLCFTSGGPQRFIPTPPPTPCYTPLKSFQGGVTGHGIHPPKFGDVTDLQNLDPQDLSSQPSPLTPPGTPRNGDIHPLQSVS